MSKQWVLIRGIMSESFHWWKFLPQMQKHFPADRIHTANILGNGISATRSTPLSINENIEGLRRQVPVNGKKILFGFSLGGMLALEWAHKHPEEVEAVVLVNCSLNNSSFLKRMTPYSVGQIYKSVRAQDLQKREEIILRLTTARLSDEERREIAQSWGPRGQQVPVHPMNFLWQLLIAARIPQRKTPPAPVLILSSGKDRVVSPECSELLARTWNLPLVRHPEAGHDLTLEDPDWVLEKVSSFIAPANAANADPKPAHSESQSHLSTAPL